MPRQTRTRLRGEQRRTELLEVSTTLIAHRGFQKFSLDDLAAASGTKKSNILYHFGSKQALLVQVLERRDEQDSATLRTLITSGAAVDARGSLDAIVRRNIAQPEIVRLYAVLSAESLDPSHPAHDYFQARFSSSITAMSALFEGAGRPARDIAVEVYSFMDGLQLSWLRDPGIDPWTQWSAFADALFGSRTPH